MIADYTVDMTLYDQCLTLMDSCFPGIKAMADKGRSRNAYWDKASIPFILREGQEIIAHLGLWPFEFVIQGKHYNGVALHGICTKEEFRKKGHFTKLMQEASKFAKENYDFSFLFTDKPYLYEKFGFKVLEEHDFVYDFASKGQGFKIRKIDLDNPEDLSLVQRLYSNRVPLSNCFSIAKENAVTILNLAFVPVYYIEELDTLVVYQIKDDVLYVKDIVSTKTYDLNQILSSISDKFSKVILQFSPDNFLKIPFNPTTAVIDGYFMISKDFNMPCASFRYPEMQRC